MRLASGVCHGIGRPNMFAYTLSWLVHQGYVAAHGTMNHERAFLTDKAFAAMNIVPDFGQTLGSQLVNATEEASSETGKNKIAELVGSFFGSLIGSATKSLSGG